MKFSHLTLILLLFAASCSQEERQQFEHSGGKLTMALELEPTTKIPRIVRDYYSATVLNQVYEGLVSFDPKTVKVIPQLAKEWTKSDDGKTYSFTIRDDVYFHEHEVFGGSKENRLLQVEDVVASVEKACSFSADGTEPTSYSLVYKGLLKGADEFIKGKSETISGLKTEENTIHFELLHEDHNFLNKMANVTAYITSKKMMDAGVEQEPIGTGPFKYTNFVDGTQSKLILTKNNEYYLNDEKGNALPYLDSLVFVFESRKLEQLDMFETGGLDIIIGLPTSRITRMLEGRIKDFNSKPPKLVLANNPLLESHFYFFDLTDERFKDPKVRKAFNYAVDREAIGREILRNQFYELGYYGITPPISRTLRGYDFKLVKEAGYEYNPAKARKLLAEAGYPNGEGFGSVELRYNIDDTHSAVADEFSKHIFKVLNINVNIDGSSFEQLDKDGSTGNGDIFRMGWSADYPSSETFLTNFYGKHVPESENEPSYLNKSRYKNPLFDSFFEQASSSTKLSDQMKFFSKAEVELLKDPPIIPLWYTGDIEIQQSYVRDFHFNAINYFSFRRVYLKEWTEEEYQEKHEHLSN